MHMMFPDHGVFVTQRKRYPNWREPAIIVENRQKRWETHQRRYMKMEDLVRDFTQIKV